MFPLPSLREVWDAGGPPPPAPAVPTDEGHEVFQTMGRSRICMWYKYPHHVNPDFASRAREGLAANPAMRAEREQWHAVRRDYKPAPKDPDNTMTPEMAQLLGVGYPRGCATPLPWYPPPPGFRNKTWSERARSASTIHTAASRRSLTETGGARPRSLATGSTVLSTLSRRAPSLSCSVSAPSLSRSLQHLL
mmetsp:Transcript_4434/g.10732  ORF Transcript_4434/g.10732 Transcript_4434/m.10732 type:complete len:192 (-) Transcript_4434:106-681(-)